MPKPATNFRRATTALAAASICPALLGMAFTAGLTGLAVTLPISLIMLTFLYRSMDGIDDALLQIGTIGPAPKATGKGLADGVRQLVSRLEGLEHRWVKRHAISGLPIRESLLERIAESLDTGAATTVGAVRFADYKRLAAFDPDAAEAALKSFADRLTASLGQSRFVAHIDRDTFAILQSGVQAEAAQREMTALCYSLGAEISAESIVLIPDIEASSATHPHDGAVAPALLNHAIISLAPIGGGRQPAQVRTAEDARERFTIEQGLRLAIERHELELNFQPVVDLGEGLLVGAEALLRWRHPKVGLIEPARFIPVLENSDLSRDIGLWVLNQACGQLALWRKEGLCHLKVAVNLAARQLHDPRLEPAIKTTLARHSLPPDAVELELTETVAAEDAISTRRLFTNLRALGLRIAIDDFGSGYSSLSYLKNLPFDKLKIDREFVSGVDHRRDCQAICRSIVELGRGLGIAVLAEGVETLGEVEALQRFGCNLFQGFYFSRPLTADDFLSYAKHPDGRAKRADAREQRNRLERSFGT